MLAYVNFTRISTTSIVILHDKHDNILEYFNKPVFLNIIIIKLL